jgi:hypothetical protein
VWNLVCSQGPLCFALGNHPKSGGGFTKAGLETPLAEDPTLNFSYPPHLYLYNHGFLAGLDWMRDDPSRWMRLAGRKLAIFWEGAAQGLTGQNWPLGRTGVRRAVDTFTARSPWSGVWGGVLGGLMLVGLVVASKRRIGGVWVLVLLSKVITNVAFYGYARQAASVIGAFDVFIALGIDGLLTLALRPLPAGKLPRWGRLVWLAPVAAMVVLELRAGEQKLWPVYGPSGPPSPSPLASVPPPSKPYYWAAPRWGSGAFESVYDLDMQRRR